MECPFHGIRGNRNSGYLAILSNASRVSGIRFDFYLRTGPLINYV